MQPESPAQKPSRKRHLVRWIFIGILAILGWYGWKAYDFHMAVKEAKELGWGFDYNDPFAKIRENWKAAFRKETWSDTTRWIYVDETDRLVGHFDVIYRLDPTDLTLEAAISQHDLSEFKRLSHITGLRLWKCPILASVDALKEMKGLRFLAIIKAPALVNVDALKELDNLEYLDLGGCSSLTNLDALRDIKALKYLKLSNCTGLKNVDGLLGLTGLEELDLESCTGLTKEAVDAVKAALPKTNVNSDYK